MLKFSLSSDHKGAGLFAWLLLVATAMHLTAQTGQSVYTDSLQNGWEDWGWAPHDYNNSSPVHAGSKSVSVSISDTSSQALYLHHAALDTATYSDLTFWIHGGTNGGQQLKVQALLGNTAQPAMNLPTLAANTWQQITLSLASLGVASQSTFTGFWIQDRIGAIQPTFYVDDITLTTNSTPSATVVLTSPATGANFLAPATINLAATVTTNGHTINKVQFYNSAILLGEDLSPPYGYTWTNVSAGGYSLTARVVFDTINTANSAAVNITVVTNLVVSITVDGQKNRLLINPLIYGVAFASSNQLADLNSPLNRSGGNSETRYNWQLNAHNHAADWYFESIPDSPATPGAAADNHVANSKNGGAQPMLTIPMIGWMPKLTPSRSYLASYSITKYGPQADHDTSYIAWYDFGNGVGTNSATQKSWLIITNDPIDANFPTNSAYQQAFVQHLTNRWGLSTNGGVRYYCMDNEHALWNSTHRDVHPVGTTMQEIRDKLFDYGAKVKAVDPDALLVAPEEWGWPGYLYSGYDWQWAGANNDYNSAHFPDRSTNGGWDYGPWLLNQARQYELTNGQRLLDVFTFHIYPQGANQAGNDVSTATQLGRNRSTRALWDPSYVDQSWINSIIKLIPRMKEWVTTYYPGTKIGITEYNWGAEGHINGATAQADILGIFGREGLDLATRWTTPASSTPTYKAMKMYRNYDGNKSTFGDTSVSASGPNPDNVSTFAAVRSSDGALTIMAVNKQLTAGALTALTVTNFLPTGTAQVWQLTSANTITHLSDINFTGNTFSNSLPPQSITLFVIPSGTPPSLRVTGASGNDFNFWLDGQAGQRYGLLSSGDFVNWQYVQTNTLASNSLAITVPVTNSLRFFRAQWLP